MLECNLSIKIEQKDQYETDEKAKQYDIFKKNNLFFSKIDVPSTKKLLGDLTGKSCIDFACGAGHSTTALVDQNAASVFGVDLSEKMIQKAKDIWSDNNKYSQIQFLTRNCAEPVKLGEFDLVYSSHFLNYAENKEALMKFVSSMYDSLKTDGFCCGLMVNGFLDPKNFSKISKYGFEFIRNSDQTQTVNLFSGNPNKGGEFLFSLKNYHWDPSVHEECFKKCGFKNFEWISPTLDNNYIDETGFFNDFFYNLPFILFKAHK